MRQFIVEVMFPYKGNRYEKKYEWKGKTTSIGTAVNRALKQLPKNGFRSILGSEVNILVRLGVEDTNGE